MQLSGILTFYWSNLKVNPAENNPTNRTNNFKLLTTNQIKQPTNTNHKTNKCKFTYLPCFHIVLANSSGQIVTNSQLSHENMSSFITKAGRPARYFVKEEGPFTFACFQEIYFDRCCFHFRLWIALFHDGSCREQWIFGSCSNWPPRNSFPELSFGVFVPSGRLHSRQSWVAHGILKSGLDLVERPNRFPCHRQYHHHRHFQYHHLYHLMLIWYVCLSLSISFFFQQLCFDTKTFEFN